MKLENQLNILMGHCQNGLIKDAERLAKSITKEYPNHPFSWGVLGALLGQSRNYFEALDAYQTLAKLTPKDPLAHYNLAITLKELGRLNEAVFSYRQAIALKTDFAEAHNNLGIILQELGILTEAKACCMQAIALRPNYIEAHFNLGVTLEKLDKLDDACSAYIQVLNLNPDMTEAYVNINNILKKLRFNSARPMLYPILIKLITIRNFSRPSELAASILSLLRHDPIIKESLLKKNFTNLKGVKSTILKLNELKVLHHLMRVCPLIALDFEIFFVEIRFFLLRNLDKLEEYPELIYFLSSLSLQCFINEYIYFESVKELELINNLQARITHTLDQSKQPEILEILCLSSYRFLHKFDWCQKLTVLDSLNELKTRLIDEPLAEKDMVKDIAMLKPISDNISSKVREQYEENPYPRWVKLAIPFKKKSIAEVCDINHLHLHSESIKNVTAPKILIAGCGTGQQSIEASSYYYNSQVTAVDLSLASLAYSKRKANELNINNLEHFQADILNLCNIDMHYDIIECMGVLHHMNEPMAGWKILTNLLNPGGLMRIGLYSELARTDIVNIREKIALSKVGTSEREIREFRWSLAKEVKDQPQNITNLNDFYSLSTLRDLIFHIQEHRFTLPQIKDSLNQLGLKFCGFEGDSIVSRFKRFYSSKVDIYDLSLWNNFEEKNPYTFSGMYQFWCQKL